MDSKYTCPSFKNVQNCYNLHDSEADTLKRHLRVSARIPEAHRSPVPLPDEGWQFKMESSPKHRKRLKISRNEAGTLKRTALMMDSEVWDG